MNGYLLRVRSLGAYLARTGVAYPWAPDLQYRGVDRLPFIPTPEADHALAAENRRLAQLWRRYGDATFEIGMDAAAARALRDGFQAHGLRFEAIVVEVAAIPAELGPDPQRRAYELADALDAIERAAARRGADEPGKGVVLGLDLAWPVPTFHSALFQPGLAEERPDVRAHLNPNGLFSKLEPALGFLDAANRLGYGTLPFCALRVSALP